MPPALICGPNEVLALVDSGSSVNAAWVSKHFPEYARFIEETMASRRGDTATTAGGHTLRHKGKCRISATCSGQDFSTAFRDMEVEMPILSMRKITKEYGNVTFTEDGGYIQHRGTGSVIHFHEWEGTYFMKLQVGQPEQLQLLGQPGFHRPGP